VDHRVDSKLCDVVSVNLTIRDDVVRLVSAIRQLTRVESHAVVVHHSHCDSQDCVNTAVEELQRQRLFDVVVAVAQPKDGGFQDGITIGTFHFW
jgi:hypothetical protein